MSGYWQFMLDNWDVLAGQVLFVAVVVCCLVSKAMENWRK